MATNGNDGSSFDSEWAKIATAATNGTPWPLESLLMKMANVGHMAGAGAEVLVLALKPVPEMGFVVPSDPTEAAVVAVSVLGSLQVTQTVAGVTVAGGGLSPVPLTSFASSKSLELKTSLAREPLGDSLLAASTSFIADGPLLTGDALLPRPSRSHLMPTD